MQNIRRLLPFLIIAAFVALLWLPFGLKTTALMEEWLSYNSYERPTPTDRNEPVGFITVGGIYRLRPLQDTTTAFAHFLTPDSFVGLNLVHMVSILVKGIGFYLVLTQLLPRQHLFALSASLLLVVFPADRGIFTFRAIHIHGAVAAYLFAVYFLLRAREKFQPLPIFLMWALVIITIFIYEVGYLLVLVTPLLLLMNRSASVSRRRLLRLGILWYLAPVVTVLYSALTLGEGPSYQSWVLQHSGISQPSIFLSMGQAVINLYYQHFIGGWLNAGSLVTVNAGFTLLAVILSGVAIGIGWWLFASDRVVFEERTSRTLFTIGIVVIFFGFALFLITSSRDENWRVFLYSSVGGALCFVILCSAISRNNPKVFVVLIGTLLFFSTVAALHQQQHYGNMSREQQQLLSGVVAQVPQPDPNIPIIVVDETERYVSNWSLGTSYLLTASLQYVYQNYDLQFVLCSYRDDGQFVALPELRERCQFERNSFRLYQDAQIVREYSYDQVIVLRNTVEGTHLLTVLPSAYLTDAISTVTYDPTLLFDPDANLPRRFGTMFALPLPEDAS